MYVVLGNGDIEKRIRQLGVPCSAPALALAKLYRSRGMGPQFHVLNHAVCHSSLGSYGLRVICSDWDFELRSIAACGRVVVATSCDDVVCSPQNARYVASQIPNAKFYESTQGWNHDFMMVVSSRRQSGRCLLFLGLFF